jgi:hypothetical protein
VRWYLLIIQQFSTNAAKNLCESRKVSPFGRNDNLHYPAFFARDSAVAAVFILRTLPPLRGTIIQV